ncbi:potential transcriptional repressor subunit [Pseudozyma hubeiensis SY62]|uniref:Potential transcriptional repressor subunit n=1 Tax=Pseudozyma hubeiensis (strain SY62) TaxID=1305764 RepID=R9PCF5_PSEHS|nr:potential transcriptional repressor subunit [Pseudozyma hubeiensis SY62]GAC99039.1 potential transcriptional repressor subunit [Pseudozyma hubeiensis SY62]
MAIKILTGIEDTLALILECGSDLARIESTLLPALRKLCKNASSDGEASNARSAAGSSRSQAPTATETALCAPIQSNLDPLSALDPSVHSVGMLYILAARAKGATSSTEGAIVLLSHITAFVQRFDPAQVQLAGDRITQLASTFTALGDQVSEPETALQLLQALASRFLTRSESITTLHPMLAYQYLKTARYAEAATMLLDLPLIDADTSLTPLTHSDVLQYFYYSALIFIKLDRLHDAIDALETVSDLDLFLMKSCALDTRLTRSFACLLDHIATYQCVSSPAVAASAIHMDAYKKLLLVQLLANGKTSRLPKYTSQAVTRSYSMFMSPYDQFVSFYERRGAKWTDELHRLAEDRHDAFEKDRNVGLVRRCLALHRQRRIQRLGKVYSALSLGDIAQKIGVEGEVAVQEVYGDVQEIVRKGWIHATLSPPPSTSSAAAGVVNGDWVVNFDTFGGESYTSTSSISLLEDKIRTAKQWQTLLQQRDRQIEKSHAYLTRLGENSISAVRRETRVARCTFQQLLHLATRARPDFLHNIAPLSFSHSSASTSTQVRTTSRQCKMVKRSAQCKFPVARIKKIMQADEDVGKVAQATPVLICKLSQDRADYSDHRQARASLTRLHFDRVHSESIGALYGKHRRRDG